MLSLEWVPPQFQQKLQFQIERWCDRTDDSHQQALQDYLLKRPEKAKQLAKMWICCDYLTDFCLNQPAAFLDWLEQGNLDQSLSETDMATILTEYLAEESLDAKLFDRQLRQFRRAMMLRIIWRDFCRLADFAETSRDMSHLAEVIIQTALGYHYHQLSERFGIPMGKHSAQPQPMVVLGMGKLGGYELNVSSDIDLIFAYPESGETAGGPKVLSNQEFFIKLSQKLIASIDTMSADGFVFRVDMRLRPYGESGAMVLNFDAMEEYYQTQGRDWERYAMIKARVVSGDAIAGGADAGEQLMAMLQPFTYRRYLDYSAIESMRSMKELINREVKRKGISGDVKLGAGGIREIEFVVQVFQMIRGGRDSRLRERSVLKLLPLLEQEGYLPEGEAQALMTAYIFLRNTEHAIQGYQDRQTQSLPIDADGQSRLAWVMGFDNWAEFEEQLNTHRHQVHDIFASVIAAPQEEADVSPGNADWNLLWPGARAMSEDVSVERLQRLLTQKGFNQADEMALALVNLLSSRSLMTMQAVGRDRLDQLMPLLLAQLSERQEPAETLRRIIVLIEAVARRSAYFTLLIENPGALVQLVSLCGSSQWIAEQLAKYPALLDELLDVRSLYQTSDQAVLRDELRQEMMRVNWDDMEMQMEVLRYFRNAHCLRVAAAEVTGVMPLMKVSDYLSWIAEVILEHVVALAWQQMISRHGRPQADEEGREAEFIVIGYGKLGGFELGHSSDLDLVFLYDAKASGYSDGDKSLDHQTYFTRLGQKIIHVLNTTTLSGPLYEVDMRLRPSGNSGLLVSSIQSFAKYQREAAWTWEHQALIRARVIAGGTRLAHQFDRIRAQTLSLPRELGQLRDDVVTMRQKMRDHLGSKPKPDGSMAQFHLKQDAGGMVDIEFLVQYFVLAYAQQYPSLLEFTDNVRLLEIIERLSLLPQESVQCLREGYIFYRSIGHKISLQGGTSIIPREDAGAYPEKISAIWDRVFSGESTKL